MKALLISLMLWVLLVVLTQFTEPSPLKSFLGGLPLYGWVGILVFLALAAIQFAVRDAWRARQMLEDPVEKHIDPNKQTLPPGFEKYDIGELDYPHPVINPDLCIACEACVDACPHDVFTIVDKVPKPLAPEQCMEDTSCQTVCPVTPKACIVVGTTKKIPVLQFPVTENLMSGDVSGCYIIGDVSGRPMIKNAANEGAKVIESVIEDLKNEPSESDAEFDVAIIGIGPAGLSAAIRAKRRNLSYLAIEQSKVLSTIDAFPKGKDIFFKPETQTAESDVPITPELCKREAILDSWRETMTSNEVIVNEEERCKKIQKAENSNYFTVHTEKLKSGEQCTYRARRVVLALGRRGNPMTLGGPGGKLLLNETKERVKYDLPDAKDYVGRRVLVAGGGNSAIEAAVALVADSDGCEVKFRPPNQISQVTLLVRTGFTNDLKFANKQKFYKCKDEGRIKLYWDTAVKEIREGEVVLMDWPSEEVKATIPNDDILALIGADFPWAFLEASEIKRAKND